jgi:hypothetical protein
VRRVRESETLEHTIICAVHDLEVGIELFLSTMEGVGIFHEKLATTKES